MIYRKFTLRLRSSYIYPEDKPGCFINELTVEQFMKGKWQPFELNTKSPGFQTYVYSLFTCQHLYFRTNCVERGLLLDHAEGNLQLVAGEDWRVRTVNVEFTGRLSQGSATDEDCEYIAEHMEQCPVSRNLRDGVESQISVRFES